MTPRELAANYAISETLKSVSFTVAVVVASIVVGLLIGQILRRFIFRRALSAKMRWTVIVVVGFVSVPMSMLTLLVNPKFMFFLVPIFTCVGCAAVLQRIDATEEPSSRKEKEMGE